MAATAKIELTKAQNNKLAARFDEDTTLKLACQFAGMCRDYSHWVLASDVQKIEEFLGEPVKVLERHGQPTSTDPFNLCT